MFLPPTDQGEARGFFSIHLYMFYSRKLRINVYVRIYCVLVHTVVHVCGKIA